MTLPIEPIRDSRPLSLQVFEALRARIAAGEFSPSERLPKPAACTSSPARTIP